MNPAGSGSNEVLSLCEAAERLSVRNRRPDRSALVLLRRLERATGRRIVVSTGAGRGRRHLILVRELEAALDGDQRDVSELAEKVAAGVQRIEERVQAMSERVHELGKRVEAVEAKGQTRLMF